MTGHSSASPRKQSPRKQSTQKFKLDQPSQYRKPPRTLSADLKRRARLLAVDSRVDPRTHALIRYGLENKDPYLEQVVRRIEGGEMYIQHIHLEDD